MGDRRRGKVQVSRLSAAVTKAGSRPVGMAYTALAAAAWSLAGILQRQLHMGLASQLAGRAVFASLAVFVFVAVAERGRVISAFRAIGRPGLAVVLVGHNPGLEALATLLAREPVRRKERARHEALEEKFPTCALAIMDFDVGRWRDVAPGTGKLVDFVRPKDL